MARTIYSYVMHRCGVLDDTALEMASAAVKMDEEATVVAVVMGAGSDLEKACHEIARGFHEVWKITDDALAYPNAEIIRALLVRMIPKGSIVLLPHDHFGMDLGPGLSIKLDAAYLPDVVELERIDEDKISAVRQEFGGQLNTRVECHASRGAVITLRPGSFEEAVPGEAAGRIVDKTSAAINSGLPETGRRFLGLVPAEAGEVDITQSEILVSIGRGIGDQENLEMAFDLAKAMGGDLSCSRPLVDAKWLGKDRQVGNSGNTVKPKVYLALGISGAFQHLAGIKGNPFIVAVNKNRLAPVFQRADVGVVADILELIPALTQRVKELKGQVRKH
jgi:electron transfer flavoprotein alpha subunit